MWTPDILFAYQAMCGHSFLNLLDHGSEFSQIRAAKNALIRTQRFADMTDVEYKHWLAERTAEILNNR